MLVFHSKGVGYELHRAPAACDCTACEFDRGTGCVVYDDRLLVAAVDNIVALVVEDCYGLAGAGADSGC